MPTAITTDPTIGKTRYRPVRVTTLPALTDATISPSTIGNVRSPETVALTPWQNCRYVGRKVIQPSSAKPTMKLSTALTLNTFRRNSRSGRIGSAARLSAATKQPRKTTPPTTRPMMVGEPQAYWVPPQLVARISPADPSEMNTMPRVSKIGRPEVGTDGSSLTARGMITSAIGTLT